MEIVLQPIGMVDNQFLDRIPEGWETALTRLVIEQRWQPALDGIEEFSHVMVLFWLNRIPHKDVELRIHPESRQDAPLVGLFATRTPYRPNRLGLQVVELLSRQENTLTVRGLDALHGSPIIDIKPYLPWGDSVPAARIPGWLSRLWDERESPAAPEA